MLTFEIIKNSIKENYSAGVNKLRLRTSMGDIEISGIKTLGPNRELWVITPGGEVMKVSENDTLVLID